jgi:hypothetical protein
MPGTDSFKFYAPIVGVWGGVVEGGALELALWPSSKHSSLAGIITWGNCKSTVDVFRLDDDSSTAKDISHVNPELSARNELYWLEKRSGRFNDQIGIVESNCTNSTMKYAPGFALVIDKEFSSLDILLYPYKTLLTSDVKRSSPSELFAKDIQQTQNNVAFLLSTAATASLCDPKNRYADLIGIQESEIKKSASCYLYKSEKAAVKSNESIDRGYRYWYSSFETMGTTFYGVFSGDFALARDQIYHNLGYVWLMDLYGARCGDEISGSKTRITIDTYTRVKDQFGEYDKDRHTKNVVIDSSYVSSYKNAREKSSHETDPWFDIQDIRNDVINLVKIEGCSSPVVKQLIENYHRSINQLQPVQKK